MSTPPESPAPQTTRHLVASTAQYIGDLKCVVRHKDSGVSLTTAAPIDNNGDGSSFSPTDLVGAALGTCILTTMAIVAGREGIPFTGASVRVEKEMTAQPVRRIGRLGVRVEIGADLNDEHLARLTRVAAACPVHRSLHPETEIDLTVVRRTA